MELTRHRRVLAVYVAELAAEDYRRYSPLAQTRDERHPKRTLLRVLQVVRPVPEAAQVLGQPDARAQFLLQDVALVHEQHELDSCQELV